MFFLFSPVLKNNTKQYSQNYNIYQNVIKSSHKFNRGMIRITCSNKGSMAVRRQDICHRSRIGTIVSIKYRLAEIKGAGPHKHPQSHLSLITALLFSHAFTNFLSLPQPYFTLYHTHFRPFLLSLPPPPTSPEKSCHISFHLLFSHHLLQLCTSWPERRLKKGRAGVNR